MQLKVSWRTEKNLIVATALFSAMQNAVKPVKAKGGAEAQIVQPLLSSIVVEDYQM